MYCRVIELWENGHLLPGHQIKNTRRWHEGEFTLEPCQHENFNRTLHRAKLIHPIEAGGHGNELVPYLYDASVVVARDDWMRVSGFYFDSFSKHALMQTWHIIVLANSYREWVILDQLEKQRKEEEKLKRNRELKE